MGHIRPHGVVGRRDLQLARGPLGDVRHVAEPVVCPRDAACLRPDVDVADEHPVGVLGVTAVEVDAGDAGSRDDVGVCAGMAHAHVGRR